MSLWENRLFAYAKTKTQISCAVTAQLIITFAFAIRIVQSFYYLNLKFQVNSHLLWLYSLVCVRPGQKPKRPVFSQPGSYERPFHNHVSVVVLTVITYGIGVKFQ